MKVSSLVTDHGLISIVIVNFNGERFIRNCLNSVLKTKYPYFEIIVVDNNSTDKSARILDEFRGNPRVKTIFLCENLHFAGGNNVGIRHSRGKYVVFLNSDTTVDPNWLGELHKSFQSNGKISAVQCLLLRSDGKTIDSIGGTVDYCARLFPANFLWSINKRALSQFRLFYGCGAALCIRRNVLDNIGLFDPAFPTDEVDICWRINLNDGLIILAPKSLVYHFRSGAFGKMLSAQRIFFSETAAASAILRNYEFRNILRVFPYYCFFFIAAIGMDVFVRHKVQLTFFRLKACLHVLRNLSIVFQKRAHVQTRIRRVPDEKILELMVHPRPLYFLNAQ